MRIAVIKKQCCHLRRTPGGNNSKASEGFFLGGEGGATDVSLVAFCFTTPQRKPGRIGPITSDRVLRFFMAGAE
jgi:hypothetical protein